MKKQPSGWFIDPVTKEMIIVMKKKDEQDPTANARVAGDHKVEITSVHAGPPPVGNPTEVTGWLIDVPDRPARPEGDRPPRMREQEDPSGAVSRYSARISGPGGQGSQPPIANALLGSDAPLLGPRPGPGARSTPETEQKR